MEKIFGIPMSSIMVVMLIGLALCLSVVGYIFVRRRVIFKLGVRNIPRRKAQTALIVAGLMLATLIIAAALGTGDTLNHSVSAGVYRSLGPVDELVVASNTGDGEGEIQNAITLHFDESEFEYVSQQLAGNDKVDAIGKILFSQAPVVNIGQNSLGDATQFDQLVDIAKQSEPTVLLAGIEESGYNDLGGLTSTSGDKVEYSELGENGVVLSKKAQDKLDAEVGDTMVLSLRGTVHEVKVVAIAEDSPLNGAIDSTTASMGMNLATLQQWSGLDGQISAIGISNTGNDREGLKYSDDVVETLKPLLAGKDLGVTPIKQDLVDIAELVASIFVTFFIVFGLFSIAVGILLIVLIFTMLAAERRAEMGMERAVGAPRRALIQQFIAEGTGYALLAGLVGTILGAAVSLGIGWGLGQIFGDFIEIEPYISPRSMIIAYALGVVITFLAVSLSSWRVSRLNIVAAVRDIPDAYHAHRNRKQLIWGIVMVLVGGLLTIVGESSKSQASFMIGMTLIPFGVAAIVTFFGFKPRWVLTVAGLYTLGLWLMPEDLYNSLFGKMNGDIEMFFVSGICIIAASTIVIIQNLDSLLHFTEVIGGRFRSKLAAIRLAISYPSANKGRTGMTIAMFGLIVFSLVMIASINNNFAQAFLSNDAAAGWTVRVDVPEENPIDDFTGTLEARGIDTSQFEGVGTVRQPDAGSVRVRNTEIGDLDFAQYPVKEANAAFLETSDISFSGKANGYDSDEAIIEALKNDPGVAVVDGFAVGENEGFGGPAFSLADIEGTTKTFDAPTIEIASPSDPPVTVKVIGVIDSKYSTLSGVYLGPPAAQAVFPSQDASLTNYFIKLPSSADSAQVTKDVERVLLPNGAQAVDIYQQMEDDSKSQKSFFYILEGFMGLGLVVGIAAVGVIAMRAVVERRQQIGMMRALGFQKGLVSQAFVFESAIVVILGVASGAILGLIVAWQLMNSEAFTEGASETTFLVPYLEIGVTLSAAIIAALVMAWLPARQASQVLPADALRYE